MTAQIAVLNKSAVALAADSSMTLPGTAEGLVRTTKRFPGNKLFALSRNHPVGAMFYHNSEFMGIPWETLFKMFRQRIPPAGRPTVEDYAASFLEYLSESNLSSEEHESANLCRIANDLFVRVSEVVHEERNGEPSDGADAGAVRTVVDAWAATSEAGGRAVFLPAVDCADVVRRHRERIDPIIDDCFRGIVVDQDSRRLLVHLLAVTLNGRELSAGHSGLVFAGFGEDEMFPSLIELATDGIIGGALKVVVQQGHDIARDGPRAAIVPFAQTEMVERFVSGVDTGHLNYVRLAAYQRFRHLVHAMNGIEPHDETEERVAALNEFAAAWTDDLLTDLGRLCTERSEQPILAIVRHLPKEELASMAEALVSLTSLKRRVSPEEESVGGPIDVAVISKGDGFIWRRRKHYFDPKLNADYFARTTARTDDPATEA